MTTPTQPPPVQVEEQETGPVKALARLFLVQLLAVAAITVVLTTLAVLVGHDSNDPSDRVSTVAKDPPSAGGPASPSSTSAPAATAATTTPPPTPPPSSSAPPASAAESTPAARTEVVVLNQSAYDGAAGDVADLLRGAGWTVNRMDTFSGTVRSTTVYYPDGKEKAARRVARLLPGETRVLPRFSNLSQTRLTVVLTDGFKP
jgi:LytR cell envelope-related transcriptional attenuator